MGSIHEFEQWLFDESCGDEEICALLIMEQANTNPSPTNPVWRLLERAGERTATSQAVLKAARMVVTKLGAKA